MNEKLLFEILKYLIIFVISIFLPKKLIYFVRSFIAYCFKSVIKLWYIIVIELLLIAIFFFNREKFIFDSYLNFKNFIIVLSVSLVVIIIIKILQLTLYKPKTFLSIYPSFTIKENEFITSDIQSEKINEIIEKNIEFLNSKFFIYRSSFFKSSLAYIPSFLPTLIGLKSYQHLITKKLNHNNPIAIYFQKDILNSDLSVEIFYDKTQFINTNLFKELENFTTIICKSKDYTVEQKINDILFLYYFITSQSPLDFTLDIKKLDVTINILNDLEEQLPVIVDRLRKYAFNETQLNEFNYSWKGIIKRYYSVIFLEKKDYKKSVDFIFEANNNNPYFPQFSYENAKNQYIAKYLSEMLPRVGQTAEELEIENFDLNQVNELTNNYISKLEYENYTHNYQILIEIINRNIENKELIDYIENKLSEDEVDNNNVFSLIFLAESYKYLPTDNKEKFNNIYFDRIPKVIELLEKAIILDGEFELLHIRIGTIKFMYATVQEEHMEETMRYMSDHIHLYAKYGFQ